MLAHSMSNARPLHRAWLAPALGFVLMLAGCASEPTRGELLELALREGETALAVGELDEARLAYARAVELDPADVRGLEGVARSELSRRDERAALAAILELEAALATSGKELPAELGRARCSLVERSIRADLASGALGSALVRAASPAFAPCPDALRSELELEARRRLARSASHPAEASVHFRRVLELAPGDAEASLGLARRALALGDRSAALRLLSEALSQHPANRELIELAVDALAAAGRPKSARSPI